MDDSAELAIQRTTAQAHRGGHGAELWDAILATGHPIDGAAAFAMHGHGLAAVSVVGLALFMPEREAVAIMRRELALAADLIGLRDVVRCGHEHDNNLTLGYCNIIPCAIIHQRR
jgi:hypothetical protein